MAQRGQKDLLARLADAGEEALTRLAQSPGADRIVGVATNLRDQVDALTTKVRGLEDLEKRVQKVERELAKLSKPPARSASSSRSRSASSSTSSARRSTTTASSRKSSGSTTRKKS